MRARSESNLQCRKASLFKSVFTSLQAQACKEDNTMVGKLGRLRRQ
jgi:hypothetical protein